MRGLTTLCGRDVYYIGDLQKLLAVWHENIKFFDLANYFDERRFSLENLCKSWKTISKERELLLYLN